MRQSAILLLGHSVKIPTFIGFHDDAVRAIDGGKIVFQLVLECVRGWPELDGPDQRIQALLESLHFLSLRGWGDFTLLYPEESLLSVPFAWPVKKKYAFHLMHCAVYNAPGNS